MKEVYVKVNDEWWKERILKKMKEISCTDFEIKGDFISIDGLWSMLEEAILEIDSLEEKIKDLENKDDYDEHDDIPEIHGKGISW